MERHVEAAFFGGFVDFDGRYEVDQRQHCVGEGEGPGAAERRRDELLAEKRGVAAQ